ncbi:hypothetical protein ABW19_dt0204353 [Dactylella cylindrospora]|nr:hypothetical protein ABW19_dt0204353 [Dactylella cylindrospora]
MATAKKRLTADAYTVGLIYVKPLGMHAIIVMLDEEHDKIPLPLECNIEYTLGKIGYQNVVIAGPPRGAQGKVATASFVDQIRLTFKNIRVGLLVGIGGGVPRSPNHDVRLGDVVVGAPDTGAPAVVQYDLGKQTVDSIEVTRTLNKPPDLLLRIVDIVDAKYQRSEEDFFTKHLQRFAKFPRMKYLYMRPSHPDILFEAGYIHEQDTDCESHPEFFIVKRKDRSPQDEVQIHYSTILSGDLVMKSGKIRDAISAKNHNALCFEMEAAGLMDTFPCLVIRGICDYSDSHKNSKWQEYAAATAAAYARELLLNMAERTAVGLKDISSGSQDSRGKESLYLSRGERSEVISPTATKTILSFDGGGIRSYSSLLILEKVMIEIQKKLGLPNAPKPRECFDIIGGSGTGGIVAILLGRLGMPVEDALASYRRIAVLAFNPLKSWFWIPGIYPSTKYSGDNLASAVKQELESPECPIGEESTFADTTAPKCVVLAITRVDVGSGPTLFKSYNVEPAWKACKIWEVARATSAISTFFPSFACGRDGIEFVDASFGYNNPCDVLLGEADAAIPDREIACVVSIGTGLGGAVSADSKLVDVTLKKLAANSKDVHERLQKQFGKAEIKRYWRFDEDVAVSEVAIDDCNQLGKIAGHTYNYLNAHTTETSIQSCAKAIIAAKYEGLIIGLPADPKAQEFKTLPLDEEDGKNKDEDEDEDKDDG